MGQVIEQSGPGLKFVVDKIFKWWVKCRRINSIDIAVKCGNDATVAHTEFIEMMLGVQFAAKTI